MAAMDNGSSLHSNIASLPARGTTSQTAQVSTQTLLTALHTSFASSQPFFLDIGTSVVVNTWINAIADPVFGQTGGTVDAELARRAFEHARRRTEDGCIVLGSLHESTPSLLDPFCAALPFRLPSTFHAALDAIAPFLNCVTPKNHATSRASSIAACFTLTNDTGVLQDASIRLSQSGIDVGAGLTNVPAEPGFRAFDVFYYLLSSASSPSEREFLGLRSPTSYTLLKRSETYSPPQYLTTADDSASAEDFREALKTIGIFGAARRDLVSHLAALLKLGETLSSHLDDAELESICEDAAGLLGVDPEVLTQASTASDREILITGIYESLVDWVVSKANKAISDELASEPGRLDNPRFGAATPTTLRSQSESVMSLTIVEIPSLQLGKAVALKTIFDDSEGINAEMKADGLTVNPTGHSVLTEMKDAVTACEPEMGIIGGPTSREREMERERRELVLDRIGCEIDDEETFLRKLLYPSADEGIVLGQHERFDLPATIGSSRVWFHLSIHPTDANPSTLSPNLAAWSAGGIARQLRSWRLPEWANRRNKQIDFTADYDLDEFVSQYRMLGCKDGRDGIESFILERGWSNGEVVIGKERVWMRDSAFMEAETMRDMVPHQQTNAAPFSTSNDYALQQQNAVSGFYGSPFGDSEGYNESRENLLNRNQSTATSRVRSNRAPRSLISTVPHTLRSVSGGDYGLADRGDEMKGAYTYETELDPELADPKIITERPVSKTRRLWVSFVWMLTFWIPSFVLRFAGLMKRPDVRMAWREKLVLCLFIFLLNTFVVFYIIVFGQLLCPNFDKAWNTQELAYNQGPTDFYVAVKGSVYDISKFWRLDHSHITSTPVTSSEMLPLAGKVLDPMFPIPLDIACPGLVTPQFAQIFTMRQNPEEVSAVVTNSFQHQSGPTVPLHQSPLGDPRWFNETFIPKMKKYYKGELVTAVSTITEVGQKKNRPWFILENSVYDLSSYFYTMKTVYTNDDTYAFLPREFTDLVQTNPGADLSNEFSNYAKRNSTAASQVYKCIHNQFYIGQTDFRDTPRCQVNNYILLAFTIILCAVILTKFLAALQLGAKRRPAPQDKFVICQVPCYTEGEDHLRRGLDSLTATAYDNKRKLICVICDGMIVGGGNDRPTPKIVLDILGVDPKVDPPSLPFKSIGNGSEQLNYGKVYSGLYEYEGNVVPYIVVVKIGKDAEQSKPKPGNRGKRDSQVLLMQFLNRVHHRSPMSPLELEIFHQINNIIGVDPELYEYLFMVDADTMVKEDALNRLVSSCANDAKIAGICGETSLENEERSWWTMIQVYEYYISHHLAKAFESLFGSVTCLPGCFCMYRLRTADKGKPLIISDKVISEYADNEVDTLHKKNLLALGEDRYLTTLMTKHFPSMSYKFIPDAYALTAAPETWSVLISQRRRWINSTIHNLVELMFLKDLCGFCCFSMRFVVFIDLFGTVILPATCAYLGYLIWRVASRTGQFPLISVIMIAAVYGLQAVIFIVKRQWQHVGWMIIYILAFPIYSCVLPIYAFWKQDDFSWGSTRVVIGEKGHKEIIAIKEDEGFDPQSVPLQTWDEYTTAYNLPGRRGPPILDMAGVDEKGYGYGADTGHQMDDVRSVYSGLKPASTIFTGFNSHSPGAPNMPPQSPVPFSQYRDSPSPKRMSMNFNNTSHSQLMSLGNMSQAQFSTQHQHQNPFLPGPGWPAPLSSENLISSMGISPSPPFNWAGTPSSPYGHNAAQGRAASFSRPASTAPDFQNHIDGHGYPTDAQIVETVQAVLAVVDLDTVTKKQLRSLVETRLQTTLSPPRKAFLDQRIDHELANM